MEPLCVEFYPSPLGQLTLASEGERLVGLWVEGQRHYGGRYDLARATPCATAPLCAACDWLRAYYADRRPTISSLPLAPGGTPFQSAVWQLLQKIPYGCTTTYGALAAQLRSQGIAASAQAVGSAVGRNPISIIIPCHRVLAAAPAAAWSYAAGARAKQALLRHEGALLAVG